MIYVVVSQYVIVMLFLFVVLLVRLGSGFEMWSLESCRRLWLALIHPKGDRGLPGQLSWGSMIDEWEDEKKWT